MLHIDVLFSENQIADEFLAALAGRHLPEKFFYWFPTSVRAWLNLCSDGAYRNFMRSQTLLQTYSGETLRLNAGERIEMNWSYKYARETFLELLREAGIALVAQYVSADERFLMALVRKAGR